MVLRNGIGEKHVEPVSVAHFRFAEVSVTGFGGVEQSALAVTVVVFVDEAVHTTVHSGVSGAEKVGTVQPAFLFHFFVDSHLFLRIHDIEFFVAGDSTGGELARITDLADSGTSFLSGDYDNACHRTCTVNGGCRTVFQNLETLDIVGIQSGYGGTNQCLGITGGKVIGTYVDGVFQNHAVNNPQRFGTSVNGSSSTHTNLGGSSKSARNILNGNSCRTTFQSATNVGQTVQLHIIGIQLFGGSGKKTFVHFLHTGHYHFL